MHQIYFRPELRPEPAGGAHDAPADPLVGWEGDILQFLPHFPPHSSQSSGIRGPYKILTSLNVSVQRRFTKRLGGFSNQLQLIDCTYCHSTLPMQSPAVTPIDLVSCYTKSYLVTSTKYVRPFCFSFFFISESPLT